MKHNTNFDYDKGAKSSRNVKRIQGVNSKADQFILSKNSDLIGTTSIHGEFLTKSAFDLVRQSNPSSWSYQYIWISHYPLKVSAFTWKHLDKAIPLNS